LSFNEFMRRHAVYLRTGGRYSLSNRRDMQGNRREFACRTTRISPFQMLVAAPVLGPRGERVITFFGELGKLDGWIIDIVEGGFLADIAVTRKSAKRSPARHLAREQTTGCRCRPKAATGRKLS
jgi:hypothetical protein